MTPNDQKANFEQFIGSVKKRAMSYAYQLARNKEDAEDLVQEATIRAYRAFNPQNEVNMPDAWIKQIIRNCFLDMKRRRSRRPVTTSLEAIQAQNPYFDAVDHRQQTDVAALHDEFSPSIRQALDNLTQEQRAIVLAALTEDETHAKLGEKFNCGKVTFRTRLHRAHRSLKRQLLAIDPSIGRYADNVYA